MKGDQLTISGHRDAKMDSLEMLDGSNGSLESEQSLKQSACEIKRRLLCKFFLFFYFENSTEALESRTPRLAPIEKRSKIDG